MEEYKEARTKYKKAVRKSKHDNLKKLYQEIDTGSSGNAYHQIVMKRFNSIPSIVLTKEVNNNKIRKLFPDCLENNWW